MDIFGIKSISLLILLEIIIAYLFRGMLEPLVFLLLFLLLTVILGGIICVDKENIIFLSLFKGKKIIKLDTVIEVNIKSDVLRPASADVIIIQEGTKTNSLFLLLYAFEKKKLIIAMKNQGIKVNSVS